MQWEWKVNGRGSWSIRTDIAWIKWRCSGAAKRRDQDSAGVKHDGKLRKDIQWPVVHDEEFWKASWAFSAAPIDTSRPYFWLRPVQNLRQKHIRHTLSGTNTSCGLIMQYFHAKMNSQMCSGMKWIKQKNWSWSSMKQRGENPIHSSSYPWNYLPNSTSTGTIQ